MCFPACGALSPGSTARGRRNLQRTDGAGASGLTSDLHLQGSGGLREVQAGASRGLQVPN
jgi:hypothetical protein